MVHLHLTPRAKVVSKRALVSSLHSFYDGITTPWCPLESLFKDYSLINKEFKSILLKMLEPFLRLWAVAFLSLSHTLSRSKASFLLPIAAVTPLPQRYIFFKMYNFSTLARLDSRFSTPLKIRENQSRPPTKLGFIAFLSYNFREIPPIPIF